MTRTKVFLNQVSYVLGFKMKKKNILDATHNIIFVTQKGKND